MVGMRKQKTPIFLRFARFWFTLTGIGEEASPPCELQYTVRDFLLNSADAFSSPWIRIFIRCCLRCSVVVNISIKTIPRSKRKKKNRKILFFSFILVLVICACAAEWTCITSNRPQAKSCVLVCVDFYSWNNVCVKNPIYSSFYRHLVRFSRKLFVVLFRNFISVCRSSLNRVF